MNKNGYLDVQYATQVVAGVTTNTPEEIEAAKRAICGARACRSAADAKVVLDALGLIHSKGN